MTPITINGTHNFTPDPKGAFAWLSKRSIPGMLIGSLFIAHQIVGALFL